MLSVTAFAHPYASTLLESLAFISMVLISGIALLPGLVILGVWGIQKFLARSWMNRWTIGDVLLQFPHLRLAMMALLLTLVANIGVTSLVGSFRLALGDWLETRLSADLFITSGEIDAARLRNESWIETAHQRKVAEIEFLSRKTQIIGISEDSPDFLHTSIIDPLPNAFNLWSQSDTSPNIIFANEQVRYLAGIKKGEIISLNTALGPRQFIVGGFFHDYGNVNLAFHLSNPLFNSLYPDAANQGWGIWVKQGRIEEAELGLAELGIDSARWVSQREIFDLSMAIFDRTFAITGALNTLTLLVAAAAIFISLLAVYDFRRPEYALWRVLGIPWPKFFYVAGAPVFFISAISMAFSLPLGLALSWLLINKINVVSFGWTMPLTVDLSSIALLFGLVACAVLIAFAVASSGQKSAVSASLKELGGI
jgi:putative ABC transport system permease protein